MPKLKGRLGEWDLPHVHMWKDRTVEIKAEHRPLISPKSKIVTIGSCFAEELASAMDRLNLNGAMHPTGLFYNTRSIRQEIERVFDGWPAYTEEPYWSVDSGYVHPFKSYYNIHPTMEALKDWSDGLDHQADALFKSADLIVITLGLIEIWMNPVTGNVYRQIPPPQVFTNYVTDFHRLTFGEMFEDLVRIRQAIKNNSDADIILTVSPVPLHSTMTNLDVRVANIESKSRIRDTVSEFIECYPDVHYFHSYDIVTTTERLNDFMMEDGRHIHSHAVDYILQQFLQTFGCADMPIPEVDTKWITPLSKTAARVSRRKLILRKRIRTYFNRLRQTVLL